MAPKYTLTYFPVRCRGEIPRLVFAAANKNDDYEFKSVTFDDWPSVKPHTPYGGLPILEVDGEKHGQGMAISTFLATEFGLMGKSNMDRFRIEQLLQLREELVIAEVKHFLETAPACKETLAKELNDEVYPRILGYFNDALKKNNEGSGFVIGDSLTLGDLILFGGLTTPLKHNPEVVAKFPALLEHRKRIEVLDGIKEHLATLDDTPL